MTKIYLQKFYSQFHNEALPSPIVGPQADPTKTIKVTLPDPITVSIYVDVQPSYFEIKISYVEIDTVPPIPPETNPTVVTTTKYLCWHKIPLESFQEESGFVDNTLWSVTKAAQKVMYSELDNSVSPFIIKNYFLNNILSLTYHSKPTVVAQPGRIPSFEYNIFVPHVANADMTTFTYKILLNSSSQLNYVVDPTSPALANIIDDGVSHSVKTFITPITVTGPSTVTAGSTAVVNVATDPGIAAVYLQQVHGILPKVKVPLTNGAGSFTVITTGMSAGDNIEVKIGYKLWTNATTYTQTLS
jgi:hypothetical protein